MRKMVKQAFFIGNPEAQRVSTFMTPKKRLNIKWSQFQQIDLTQRNITEDSARTDSKAQIVRERFGCLWLRLCNLHLKAKPSKIFQKQHRLGRPKA